MAVRREHVKPLSVRTELRAVAGVGIAVVVGTGMYLRVGGALLSGAPGNSQLLPFQMLVQDRPAVEQRMFRELQEALLEAEVRFSTTNVWPTAAELAADGIPPFAFDPTASGGPYTWSLVREGAFVNYLGIPSSPAEPAWLLLVQEPIPGAPPDPAREDETHHRLITGVMLRVSTWVRSDGAVATRLISAPQNEGWTELFAVGPAVH